MSADGGHVAGGAVAPVEVENTVGGLLKTGTGGTTRMRGLVQAVSNASDALAGLRKTGTLNGARLIGFLRDNRDTLRELYPHDAVSMMGALARDAEVGAKWRTETAIKGGSDSMANLFATMGARRVRSQNTYRSGWWRSRRSRGALSTAA